MKILGLTIQGLRKIAMAELDLTKGNLIEIRGRNEAGKSTILLAIEMLFGGKGIIPNDVINHDASKAEVIGKLDDFTIKRVMTRKGTHSLSVEKDGMLRTKPQEFLNAIAGSFLDPQKFSQLSGSEKKALLMKHLELDFEKDDQEIKDIEAERRLIGRDIKAMGEPVIVAKVDKIDIEELYAERRGIDDFNNQQDERKNKIDNIKGQVDRLEEEINLKEKRIEEKKVELDEKIKEIKRIYSSQIDDIRLDIDSFYKRVNNGINILKELPKPLEKKPVEEIEKKIAEVGEVNQKAEAYIEYKKKKEQYELKKNNYEDCSSKILKIKENKEKKLREAKMPIEGLKITDDGLSLNGITHENWSDSESLKVAMNISAALSSDLKTMFIKRGESLDRKSLELVKDFADKNDFQVIMEIVDDTFENDADNVFYIEEGSILENLPAKK